MSTKKHPTKPINSSKFIRKIGAHVSSAGGPVNALKNAENIGADCFQIFAGSPRMWSRSLYAQEMVTDFNQKMIVKKLDPLYIHALYLVNLATDSPDLLHKSHTALLTDLQNGDALNCSGLVVHIGSHQGRGFSSAKDQIVEQINKLLSETKTTPFVIENSAGQKGKIGSLEEIGELLEEINHDRVKVCLDTAHLFEAGWDLNDQAQIKMLVKKLKDLNILKSVTILHLNDSKTPLDSRRDQHENLGKGEIGLLGLANFINHVDLKHLPLILEVPGFEKKGPDIMNLNTARSLLNS